MSREPEASFEALARRHDDEIDVALGAALIAQDAYGDLEVESIHRELDALAAPLREEELEHAPIEEQAVRLCEYLHGSLGFRGNTTDYYDPRNSLISDVLARRTGIPITLALVHIEVGQRIGVDARGVGFPGHFLVRIDRDRTSESPGVLVDPFGGRVLDDRGLLGLAREALGASTDEVDVGYLAPASPRAMLVRVLMNLKSVYLARGDLARAHLAVTRIATLLPASAGVIRERAELSMRLGAQAGAVEDLERSLSLEPDGPEAEHVRKLLQTLEKPRGGLN